MERKCQTIVDLCTTSPFARRPLLPVQAEESTLAAFSPHSVHQPDNRNLQKMSRQSSVVTPIDQVDYDLDDDVFFLRSALGNQQGQRDQSIISQTLAAIRTIEDAVGGKKIDKNRGGDPLIAIGEG